MGIFSKFFKNKAEVKSDKKTGFVFQEKLDKTTDFIQQKTSLFKSEWEILKQKISTLLDTNYNLGLRHIERGNIGDAIFRFKFIKKFWPHCYEAYYQLAYCYILDKRPYRARKVLAELVEKCPNYASKAEELLKQINDEK